MKPKTKSPRVRWAKVDGYSRVMVGNWCVAQCITRGSAVIAVRELNAELSRLVSARERRSVASEAKRRAKK